jgi:tyrosine-protein phosphatase SIW14
MPVESTTLSTEPQPPRTVRSKWPGWVGGFVLFAAIVAVPTVHYRQVYMTEKRFRTVTPGKFYRTGQPSADVLRKIIREHGIKTIINLKDEDTDPLLPTGYWTKGSIRESQVCDEEGVNFVFISWDGDKGLLSKQIATPERRPVVIDQFLKICDDPANYPILVHCEAGLHRTGVLVAIYRMEYEGWSTAEAITELRANGYGRKHTLANDYILEYMYQFKPGYRRKS